MDLKVRIEEHKILGKILMLIFMYKKIKKVNANRNEKGWRSIYN